MRKSLLAVCVFTSSALLIAASALPASAAGYGTYPSGPGYGGTTGPNAAAQTDPLGSTTATAVTQDATVAADASGTIFGGTLSATVYGAYLSPATLNGTATQTMTGTSAPWSLIDGRGTGAAWNLSVDVSNFTSAAVTTGTTQSAARTIFGSNLAITPGSFTLAADSASGVQATNNNDKDAGNGSSNASGNTAAVTSSPLAYSNANGTVPAFTLVSGISSVAGTNLGGGAKGNYYFAAPTFTLTVPRNAYKSNVLTSGGVSTVVPYVAVITFTIS